MKAFVDESLCIGCGLCTSICPEVFTMNDDNVAVASDVVPAGSEEKAQEAADSCPVSAISITE